MRTYLLYNVRIAAGFNRDWFIEGGTMIRRQTLTIVILTLLLSVFISACGGPTANDPPAQDGGTGSDTTLDGKTLLEERCTACHTLDRVESASKSAAGWGLNVREMVGKGAELNASEQEVLIDYLSITYTSP
jgi:hypothetical protein